MAASAVALVVILPLLTPGFVLVYDMVFVPHPHLSRELLGISRVLPRSVPVEGSVALAGRLLSGMVVQKLVLLGIVGGAAYGAGRLVPAQRPAARIGAGVLYAWNPLVYERLLLGQWAFLLGYALLPWTVGAAVRVRRGESGAGWLLALAMAGAAFASPYTGVFAVVVALVMLACPPVTEGVRPAIRRLAWTLAAGVTVNLPWLVPAVLHPAVPERPALATALFRARSDSPLGLVGSLASLGGLWRTDLAPPGRSGYAWLPAFALIAGLAVVGWRSLGRRWPAGALGGLLAVAVAGLVLAAAPGSPGLHGVSVWLGAHAPGGGLLRDSQRFVVPLALALSVGFGTGVDHVLLRVERARAATARPAPSAVVSAIPAIALAVLPAALAPTLAWGAGGKLATARYPASWGRAQAIMAADPAPGAVLVLPWHTYLPFLWNGGRTVHQPASRYFSRPVVADGSLQVGSEVLPAEDPWSRLAEPAVRGTEPLETSLPSLGVRYVLLFREADWRAALHLAAGLMPVLDEPDLVLFLSPRPAQEPSFDTPAAAPVVAGDALAGLAVLLAAAGSSRRIARLAGSRLAILRSRAPPEQGAG